MADRWGTRTRVHDPGGPRTQDPRRAYLPAVADKERLGEPSTPEMEQEDAQGIGSEGLRASTNQVKLQEMESVERTETGRDHGQDPADIPGGS